MKHGPAVLVGTVTTSNPATVNRVYTYRDFAVLESDNGEGEPCPAFWVPSLGAEFDELAQAMQHIDWHLVEYAPR